MSEVFYPLSIRGERVSLRGLCLLAAAISLFAGSMRLRAADHAPKSAYNPGIHPATPADLEAEKEAENAWYAHLEVLASDALKGRRTGTPEFLQAVEYVENQFKTIGLKPVGVEGYRQALSFQRVEINAEHSTVEIRRADGSVQSLKAESDVTLSPNSEGATSVEAPAIFAGYGLVVPQLGIDDLKGLDLHGKIAVIFGGSPEAVHGPLKAYFRTAAIRWRALKAAGAVGLIMIVEPRQSSGGSQTNSGAPTPSQRPIDQLADPELNLLSGARINASVTAASAGSLFAGAARTYDELHELAKLGRTLPAVNLAITVRATTTTHVISTFQAPNVVGVLEGVDPALKHEYLLLSAHLDHLGWVPQFTETRSTTAPWTMERV